MIFVIGDIGFLFDLFVVLVILFFVVIVFFMFLGILEKLVEGVEVESEQFLVEVDELFLIWDCGLDFMVVQGVIKVGVMEGVVFFSLKDILDESELFDGDNKCFIFEVLFFI